METSQSSQSTEKPATKLGFLKLAIFLSFIISIGALVAAGMLYQTFNSEKRERKALEAAQVQLRDKASSLEETSTQYRTDFDRLQNELLSVTASREELQKKVNENETVLSDMRDRISRLEAENKKIKEQEAEQPQDQTTASSDAPILQIPSNQTITQANANTAAPAATSTSVASAPVEPAAPKTPAVLSVNRKFNFVVVNIGLRDGVKIGDALEVVRNNKTFANVTVEKLYENFAAATIAKEPKKDPIKEGDLVRKAG